MPAEETTTKSGQKTNGKPGALATKLALAAASVANVEKKGKNTAQNYDYVQAEDIAKAAHVALQDAGLVCEFQTTSATETPIKSNRGSDGLIVFVTGQLIVTDPDSGESISREAAGSGSDYPGDKAIYKAMTGARKYALIHLLGIPIGDDPDEGKGNGSGNGAAGPAKPAGTITAGMARALVDRAWKVDAAKRNLQLAASHVRDGKDVGDCSTKQKAIKAMQLLTHEQAERVDNWITEKAGAES